MWFDNETDRDFLNFESIADAIAEMVVNADGEPVSIGVSGAWGVGKSSMIRLTKSALEARNAGTDPGAYVYVEFNAWLYQGYDDARAALLDVVATRLHTEAEQRQTALDKAADFLRRVRWLRVANLTAGPAASMALGIPPFGAFGEITRVMRELSDGEVTSADLTAAGEGASKIGRVAGTLVEPKSEYSPPQQIQALRDSFEALLEELNITLVVLIDDLDRCLPPTTISTLEAIRLLLFLKRTAFVIAADDQMIKHSVRRHFDDLTDDTLVTNYFDKLIQVPIRVPALGIHEVRAYMIMLFVDDSDLTNDTKNSIRHAVAEQLKASWKGARVDRKFLEGLDVTLPEALMHRLDTAEELAHIMATSTGIAGNPRLIKRFLNALAIRQTLATSQGVDVDGAVLAKLLVFERIAPSTLFRSLASAVAADAEGKPRFLGDWEKAAHAGEPPDLDGDWSADLVHEWLRLAPPLADIDLRGALYVGREQAPLVTDVDRLGSESIAVLTALVENPGESRSLRDEISKLPSQELEVIMARLITRARQETVWGAPEILTACKEVARAEPSLGDPLARFLLERPTSQLQASIVPAIADEPWHQQVFEHWLRDKSGVPAPVKAAILEVTP